MAQAAGKQQQYTPEQIEQIKKKLASMKPEEVQEMIKKQCIFCRILAGEIPAYVVYEDKKVVSFLDIQPGNMGHLLVVPKKHYSVLPQMPDEEVGHLFAVAKQLAGVVFDTVGAEGVNILQNNGQVAGQMVPHVHVHVIPRMQKDEIMIEWKPGKMSETDAKKMQATIAEKAKSIKISTPKPKVTTNQRLAEPKGIEKVVEKPVPQPAAAKPGAKPVKKAKPKKKRTPKLKRHP